MCILRLQILQPLERNFLTLCQPFRGYEELFEPIGSLRVGQRRVSGWGISLWEYQHKEVYPLVI
jgi:hypothetical protein